MTDVYVETGDLERLRRGVDEVAESNNEEGRT